MLKILPIDLRKIQEYWKLSNTSSKGMDYNEYIRV